MFFHYQVDSLVDHRASKSYTLAGPPALRLELEPLAVLLLDNRLCIHLKNIFISSATFNSAGNLYAHIRGLHKGIKREKKPRNIEEF